MTTDYDDKGDHNLEEIFFIKQEMDPSNHYYCDDHDDGDKAAETAEHIKCILCNNNYHQNQDSYHYTNVKARRRQNFVHRFLLKQLQLNQDGFVSAKKFLSSPTPLCTACCTKLDALTQLYDKLTALQAEFERLKNAFVEECLTLKKDTNKSAPRSSTNYELRRRNPKYKSLSYNEDDESEHESECDSDYIPPAAEEEDQILEDLDLDGSVSNSDSDTSEPKLTTLKSCQIQLQRLKTPSMKKPGKNKTSTTKALRKQKSSKSKPKSAPSRSPCHICPKTFSRSSDLNRHLVYVHGEKLKPSKYGRKSNWYNFDEEETKCEICSKQFTRRDKLRVHVQMVHKYNYKPLVCQSCPTRSRFIFPASLKRHTALVHGHGAGEEQLAVVVERAEGEVPAGSVFDPETEALHQQAIEESKICRDCGLRFERVSDLRKHEREAYHGEARNNQCEHCGQAFTTKQALLKHVKNQHVALAPPSLSQTDSSSSALRENSSLDIASACASASLITLPTSTKPHYLCPYCSIQFNYKNRFDRHLATVHPVQYLADKPHLCHVCYRAFISAPLLEDHQSSAHYRCSGPGCSKLFVSVRQLRNHEVSHTGTKPHTCAICGKSYSTRDNLVLHEKKIHAGIAPKVFNCKDCGMEFKRRKFLEAHAKEVHSFIHL